MELTKTDRVNSYITDPLANLSVIGTFQIAEDAVTELMGNLKIDGLTARKEYNAVWVFVKSKLKKYIDLAWGEQYTINAFISKITLVSINIDVEIRNISNEICSYFRVELCALDLESKRIRKVSTVGVESTFLSNSSQKDIPFNKFDVEGLSIVGQEKVKYTNIDFVGHTNNKEYVRFALDTYSVEELNNCPIEEFDIAYVNQSYEDDVLSIYKKSDIDGDIIAIKKDETLIAKCKVIRSRHA